MLRIFYGRESLDKEKFIFDSLDRDGKNIIIVPDQFTLEMERDLFAYLEAECLMDTEVISMSRLGFKLLEELGGSKRRFIDKYGRHMILSRIVKEKGKELEAFRGLERKSSFIELANNFISELKQQNVKADDLKEALSCFPEESYGRKKLSDLMLIFSEYEKEIAGKYTDSEDRIDLYLSKIGKSEYIKGSNIYIYGFDSLAPKALLVISELLSFAKDVNIVLTYEKKDELFLLTGLVIKNLTEMAERSDKTILRQIGKV
ncbi:MAG: hypothetical protein MJ171_07805, partial [Clostridia bacterium]|nr:hypothetical protein [Clostridia bacterium]